MTTGSRKDGSFATADRDQRDLESKLDQLGILMRRMVRVVRVPDDHAELTPTQMVVLSLLDDGSMRIGSLAATMGAAQNTISEVVARLTRSGLVRKTPDPVDGRAVLVELTPAGRQALESRRRAMRDYHRSVLKALSPKERHKFVEAFEVLVTMVEAARRQMSKRTIRQTTRQRRNDT
jgi:DNA-binding MarR family transcriptional regulator